MFDNKVYTMDMESLSQTDAQIKSLRKGNVPFVLYSTSKNGPLRVDAYDPEIVAKALRDGKLVI